MQVMAVNTKRDGLIRVLMHNAKYHWEILGLGELHRNKEQYHRTLKSYGTHMLESMVSEEQDFLGTF